MYKQLSDPISVPESDGKFEPHKVYAFFYVDFFSVASLFFSQGNVFKIIKQMKDVLLFISGLLILYFLHVL